MSKKCNICGRKLDKHTGLCPNCNSDLYSGVIPGDPEQYFRKVSALSDDELRRRQRNKAFIIGAIALGVVLLIGTTIGILSYAGKNSLKTYSGENTLYTFDEKAVAQDEKSGTYYINNMVLVFFEEGTPESDVEQIVADINGKIVGKLPVIDQYQVEVKTSSLEELEEICSQLKENDCVVEAIYDTAFEPDDNEAQVPSDPWTNNEAWSESEPDGANWWLEAIHAQSAWEYNDRLEKIAVGIVDDGFDTSHEDLRNVIKLISSNNDATTHGTHVAGIIGAEANNGKGITGLVQNCDIFTWDWQLNDVQAQQHQYYGWNTTNQILGGTAILIENGAKVINLSLGQTASMIGTTRSDYDVYCQGYNSSIYLSCLISRGYDFVIVQSAGNGNSSSVSVDAIYNGLFTSITEENCYVSEDVSVKDVIDRIIVVGAAQNDGNNIYTQASWSNAGSRVDICAPGYDVYSCVPEGYADLSGTSMAAPVVTGVASLVWAANSDLTGADVKRIVCDPNNTTHTVWDNTSPDHPLVYTYRMVDAELAVKAALNYSSGTGETTGAKADLSDFENIDLLYTEDSYMYFYSASESNNNNLYCLDMNDNSVRIIDKNVYGYIQSDDGYIYYPKSTGTDETTFRRVKIDSYSEAEDVDVVNNGIELNIGTVYNFYPRVYNGYFYAGAWTSGNDQFFVYKYSHSGDAEVLCDNMISSNNVVCDDDNLYLNGTNSNEYGIYSISLNGGNYYRTLYKGSSVITDIDDDKIFFSTSSNSAELTDLLYVPTSGGNAVRLLDGEIENVNVYDGWVYCIDKNDSRKIKRINVSTQEIENITEEECVDFTIDENSSVMYYQTNQSGKPQILSISLR